MKTGIIYVYTSPSGKKYVGQTWCEQRRKQDHKYANGKSAAFHSAIKKYGIDSFSYEVLHQFIETQKSMNELESMEIKRLNTIYPFGYNLTSGGEGGFHHEISRKKMRDSWEKDREKRRAKAKEFANTPAQKKILRRNAINNAKNPEILKKKSESLKIAFASDDVRKYRSEQRKAEWLDPSIRARRIEGIKRAQNTDEYKLNLSLKTAERWKNQEYREKMIRLNSGKKRPQHAIDATRLKRIVKVECVETGEIFESIKIAAEFYNISHSCISCALSGKQKTAAGKTWRKVQNVNNFKAISKESNQ